MAKQGIWPAEGLAKCFILCSLVAPVLSITIPDQVPSTDASRLVYYKKKGTFYQADRLCRHYGGYLVLVDSPEMVAAMEQLKIVAGSLSDMYMRMIRHDDESLHSYDEFCQPVDVSSWSFWESTAEESYSSSEQCYHTKGDNFKWKRRNCNEDHEFVCEYTSTDPCQFMTSTVTLAALPVKNASMELCRSMCRQMTNCFATAPSGISTLPPYSMCLYVVVNDTTNPMSYLQCNSLYENDEVTDPTDTGMFPFSGTDPEEDPNDCTPTPVGNTTDTTFSLADAVAEGEAFNCTETVTSAYPMIQTAYVTMTPDVQTEYVTLTPEFHTEYVTVTPQVQYVTQMETAYVTLTPDVGYVTVTGAAETVYVTVTPDVVTAYVTVAPSFVIEYVTVTNDVYVTEQTTVIETQIQTVEVSPTCVTSAIPSVVPVTVNVTDTVISTVTSTVSATESCLSVVQSATPRCTPVAISNNRTEDEILEEMQDIVKDLIVDRNNVSRIRRKKESAKDDRRSAVTMGMSASVFLVIFVLVVFVVDVPRLHHDIKHLRNELQRKPDIERRPTVGGQ